VNTLRASADLTIEVDADGDTPLLRLRDASLEADGECLTGVVIWPSEIRGLIDCLSVAAGLLAQGAAAAPEPGPAWAFGCALGLAQEDCGAYLADPNSRGAAAGLGGCPSCAHREPDNARTKAVDYLARAKRDLAALERGESVDLSVWGVRDLRAGVSDG